MSTNTPTTPSPTDWTTGTHRQLMRALIHHRNRPIANQTHQQKGTPKSKPVDLQSSWAWSRTPFLRGSCRGGAGLCLNDTQPIEQQHDRCSRSRHNHSPPSRSLFSPRPPRTLLPATPTPHHLLHVPPSQEVPWDNTPVPALIQERLPSPPIVGRVTRWCLKTAPVALPREGE